MKSKWTRKFLKYNEDGSLRKYYVGLHGEIHEVRNGEDIAYPAPSGYSEIDCGLLYLMINGLKCDSVVNIYGINPYSHTSMVIHEDERYVNDDGCTVDYCERLILDPVKEPRVDCIKTVMTSDKRRVDEECTCFSEPFI